MIYYFDEKLIHFFEVLMASYSFIQDLVFYMHYLYTEMKTFSELYISKAIYRREDTGRHPDVIFIST